jgi:hypothetical protein
MTSDESYKNPLYTERDQKCTAEQAFQRFAEFCHNGRQFIRRPDGGYQFVDGTRVYRVTLYNLSSWPVWGVYRDFDVEKGDKYDDE